jgi:hypothetical protein
VASGGDLHSDVVPLVIDGKVLVLLRTFGVALVVTAFALLGAGLLGGGTVLAIVAILAILEISLSFDNAVVNATVLRRMNPFWQKVFLTLGIAIAVFGMRLVFPLALVSVTALKNPVQVVKLALAGGSPQRHGTYANLLVQAHPLIAAFGGMFLLMIFLDFMLGEHEITWLSWLERPLAKLGRVEKLSLVLALGVLVVIAETLAAEPGQVLLAGALGLITYLLVNAAGEFVEAEGADDAPEPEGASAASAEQETRKKTAIKASGKAAFFLFLYLEVLDASFSFDGVVGAFAINQNIFIIAVGLGIGAMFIRSLTVFLVRQGTLEEYIYLENGAHWAIGALAVILLISVRVHIPEVVTGLIGVAVIGSAFGSSLIHNRRRARQSVAEADASRGAGNGTGLAARQ